MEHIAESEYMRALKLVSRGWKVSIQTIRNLNYFGEIVKQYRLVSPTGTREGVSAAVVTSLVQRGVIQPPVEKKARHGGFGVAP